ncbi:hypothetical protein GGF32_004740 [Allomyces javanicus]|nr:hypothetical protein GGF32_004740 [Allomyces javanicus]
MAFELREYQRAVVADITRRQGNVVFTLKTGAGKTLILFEVYLRKRDAIAALSFARDAPRAALAVFIAPTHALVRQQMKQFYAMAQARGLSLVTDLALGGKNLIRGPHANDVLFATPMRLVELIQAGSVDLRRIALVMLDEVHHADKGHPYTDICTLVRAHNADLRRIGFGDVSLPRAIVIIGCSATLVQSKSSTAIDRVTGELEQISISANKRLAKLCAMLDKASVVAVTEATCDSFAHAELQLAVPETEVAPYLYPNTILTDPFRLLFDALWTLLQDEIRSLYGSFYDYWVKLDEQHVNVFRCGLNPPDQARANVGRSPLIAIENFLGFCRSRLDALLKKYPTAYLSSDTTTAPAALLDIDDHASPFDLLVGLNLTGRTDSTDGGTLSLPDARRLMDTFTRIERLGQAAVTLLELGPAHAAKELDQLDLVGVRDIVRRLQRHENRNAPKLQAIFDLIAEDLDPDSLLASEQGIVFVRRRHAAQQLAGILNNRFKHINAEFLVGQNNAAGKAGVRVTSTNDGLQRFRDGICRVLVCTSIAEEGLDIPGCSLVIYSEPDSLNQIKLTQIKGRARAKGGVCYILCESSAVDRNDPEFSQSRGERKVKKVLDAADRDRREINRMAHADATRSYDVLEEYLGYTDEPDVAAAAVDDQLPAGDEVQWSDHGPSSIASVITPVPVAVRGGVPASARPARTSSPQLSMSAGLHDLLDLDDVQWTSASSPSSSSSRSSSTILPSSYARPVPPAARSIPSVTTSRTGSSTTSFSTPFARTMSPVPPPTSSRVSHPTDNPRGMLESLLIRRYSLLTQDVKPLIGETTVQAPEGNDYYRATATLLVPGTKEPLVALSGATRGKKPAKNAAFTRLLEMYMARYT